MQQRLIVSPHFDFNLFIKHGEEHELRVLIYASHHGFDGLIRKLEALPEDQVIRLMNHIAWLNSDNSPFARTQADSYNEYLKRSLGSNYELLLGVIAKRPHSPLKCVEQLCELSDADNKSGYMSCLLLYYCYFVGMGAKPSHESAHKYLLKAVTKLKQLSDFHSIALLKDIMTKFPLPESFDVAAITFQLNSIEINKETKKFNPDCIAGSNYAVHTAQLDANQVLINKQIVLAEKQLKSLIHAKPNDQAGQTFLKDYMVELTNLLIELKLKFYTRCLQSIQTLKTDLYTRLGNERTLPAHLHRDDIREFYGKFLEICRAFEQDNQFYYATLFYELYLDHTKDSDIYPRLAEMAAEGHLIYSRNQGSYNQKFFNCDFVKAGEYYLKALERCANDMAYDRLAATIDGYERIKANLTDKHQEAIQQGINQQLDDLIAATGQRAKEGNLRNVKSLIVLMCNQKVEPKFYDALRSKVQSVTEPSQWLLLVAAVAANPLDRRRQPHSQILATLDTSLALLSDTLLRNFDINTLGIIMNVVDALSQLKLFDNRIVQEFMTQCESYIAKHVHIAATRLLVAELQRLSALCNLIVERLPHVNNYKSLADLCLYWYQRTTFQLNFDDNTVESVQLDKAPKPINELLNIFRSASYEKKGVSPGMWRSSYLTQLKNNPHPEAQLKAAELEIKKFSQSKVIELLNSAGMGLIKVLLEDTVGIYRELALARCAELVNTVTKDKTYSEKAYDVVHFYYHLALLNVDPLRYHQNKIVLFTPQNCQWAFDIIVELTKNPALKLIDNVKQQLLTELRSLPNLPEPLLKKAQSTLVISTREDSVNQVIKEPSTSAVAVPPPTFRPDDKLPLELSPFDASSGPRPAPAFVSVNTPAPSAPPMEPSVRPDLEREVGVLTTQNQQLQITLSQKENQIAKMSEDLQAKDQLIAQLQAKLSKSESRLSRFKNTQKTFAELSQKLLVAAGENYDSDEEHKPSVKP